MFRTKLLGLLLSAVMTSLAGGSICNSIMAIDPETAFGLSQAIQLQLPALIGGLGTPWGPIIGGAVMTLLSESTNWGSTKLGIVGVDILVYGLLLLAVVMCAPKGIVGGIRDAGPATSEAVALEVVHVARRFRRIGGAARRLVPGARRRGRRVDRPERRRQIDLVRDRQRQSGAVRGTLLFRPRLHHAPAHIRGAPGCVARFRKCACSRA